MSENPELGYYQAVVDDLRVSNERGRELIDSLREEVVVLRRIVAAAHLFIGSMNEDSVLDEGDCLLELSRQITAYETSRRAVL